MQPIRQYREDFGKEFPNCAATAAAAVATAPPTTLATTLWFDFEGVRLRVLKWSCAETLSEAAAAQDVSRETFGKSAGVAAEAGLPLVFLHGFAQSADVWDEVARLIVSQPRTDDARAAGVRTDVSWASAVRTDAARTTSGQVGGARPGTAARADAVRTTSGRVGSTYALDFVGHGQSARPESSFPYSMDFACDMLLAFLRFVRQENAGQAPVVVGYSMGGRITLAAICHALELASFASEPDLPLSALVLESAGMGPASEEERIAVAQANARRAQALRAEGVERFMDAWERLPLFATQQELPDEVRVRLRAGRLSNDAEALARTFEGTGAQHMPDRGTCLFTLAALIKQGVPVRYLAGQRDEKYSKLAAHLREIPSHSLIGISNSSQPECAYPSACGSHFAASPSIEVFIAPDVGHNVHVENPSWFLERILV